MSDSQRAISGIAADWGVSQRTVRRWCERGLLPGAYRTKGGHWRIRKNARISFQLLSSLKHTRGIRCAPLATRERFESPGFQLALQFSLAAHLERLGLPMSAADDREIIRADPELHRLLWDVPLSKFTLPQAKQAVVHRPDETRLFVAAKEIENDGGPLNATAIAKRLGVSRATLYRHFTADEIQRAIRPRKAWEQPSLSGRA